MICFISTLLFSCSKKIKTDYLLLNKINDAITLASKENKPLTISDITDFEWDYFCIIRPYSTEDMIKKLLSIDELNFDLSIEISDSFSLLVFTKSNSVVKVVEFPANYVDFSRLSSNKFNKSEAVFKIFDHDNWKYLIELDQLDNNNLAIPKGYRIQEIILTSLVIEAFYKIKDSIDYGEISVKGQKPNNTKKIKEKLIDYSRIDEEFLTKLMKKYSILSYTFTDIDYELILINRYNHNTIFKATRQNMYYWKDNVWVDLGGYYYI
ncbi:MAG: hypothetical protein PVH88_27960 [Ignavibacteria bacterium]